MEKRVKKMLCGVLAACFLVGCGVPSSLSGQGVSSAGSGPHAAQSRSQGRPEEEPLPAFEWPSPLPEHMAKAEPWQRAYYEYTYKRMLTELSGKATLWKYGFLYPEDGTPFMVFFEEGTLQIVGMEEGGTQAKELYAGEAADAFINADSGNPVFYKWEETGGPEDEAATQWFELVEGEVVEIDAYSLPKTVWGGWQHENPGRSRLKELSDVVSLNMQPREPKRVKRFLNALFFFEYEPPLPAAAPDWAARYLQLVYKVFMPYSENEEVTIGRFGEGQVVFGRDNKIELFPAVYKGGPPLLYAGGLAFNPMTEDFFFIWDGGIETIPVITYSECGASLHVDANGEYLVKYNDWVTTVWYKPAKTGLEFMFEEVFGDPDLTSEYGTEGMVYCDGAQRPFTSFGSEEEAIQWAQRQQQAAQAKRGYALPLTKVEEPIATLTLPKQTTWTDLEVLLIEFFCNYARATGQWG